MRIAHVIDYFQPRIGYQEFYLATLQREMGHEVEVVTSDRYFPFPAYEATAGRVLGKRYVGVGLFEEESVLVRRLPCLYEHSASAFIVLRGLKNSLAHLLPEVVHCHGIFSVTAHRVAMHKGRLGYRLVYDNHAADYNTNLHNTWPKRIYWSFFSRVMAPTILQEADAIVAIGEAEQDFACRELGLQRDAVAIIPLGADVRHFKFDQRERTAVRESLGVADKDVLLIYAGKPTPDKDIHVLLEAVRPLMRENRSLKLLILGAGTDTYSQRLRALARQSETCNHVVFHDFVHHTDLPRFLSAADIGVWPGHPSITIQEAMACGLPLILPDSVMQRQTTKRLLANNNGLFFQRGNAVELGEQIARLVTDKALRQDMARRSRKLAEAQFSWSAVATEFLSIYEAIPLVTSPYKERD